MAEIEGQVKDEELDPEQQARRRLALAQIRQYPDPALRLTAHAVEEFDDDLRRLAGRMTVLMADASGIGLAATQVGILRRLFVCRLGADGDEGEGEEEVEVRAFVNPVIAATSEERETDDEGCLSLQRVLVPVERAASLTLEARDLDGEPVRVDLSGLDARVVQHELDHLDGVLILDRTTDEARREALAALRPRPVLTART
jgi:peptide deformylase